MRELLTNKIAVITGGARGMGAAIAEVFAREGAQVILADVLDDDGAATASQIGPRARYRHLDVSSEAEWAALATWLDAEFGGADILVNNAGIVRFKPIVDTSLEEYMLVTQINQVGTFLGMRACIPLLKKRGGGAIVNISSVDGMKGSDNMISYASSKWAVRGMTKVAAMELGRDGIRVNSIHPGSIQTAMTPGPDENEMVRNFVERLPIPRIGSVHDVANTALFLASELSAYTTGGEFMVEGGLVNTRPFGSAG
jgi:3alpha(or 20beta)-hydroxysteroid dehydrogenase